MYGISKLNASPYWSGDDDVKSMNLGSVDAMITEVSWEQRDLHFERH